MRKISITLLLMAGMALSACSKSDEDDGKLTQIRMDNIDSIEGTINDDMINTDVPVEAPQAIEQPKPEESSDK